MNNNYSIMRAKLRAVSVTPSFFPKAEGDESPAEKSMEQLVFCGVAAGSYPPDGSDENNTFAKWSPSIDLKITVANPVLFGAINANDEFYVDFTRVGSESPAAAIEPGHITGLSFGAALEALKAGHRVSRAGWNGKGMWLALQTPDDHSKMRRPYIYMSPVDGELVPWLASQTDMLADDWEILPPAEMPKPTAETPAEVPDPAAEETPEADQLQPGPTPEFPHKAAPADEVPAETGETPA